VRCFFWTQNSPEVNYSRSRSAGNISIWFILIILILGGSVHAIKQNTEALVAPSKETGLEVNADKTKHMVMSRDQNAGLSHNIKKNNSSF